MTTRVRILVASTPDGQYRVQQALSAIYDLKLASTVTEAERLLSEGATSFHMVITGIHFDDSRMVELLQFVRSAEPLAQIPFLITQVQASAMHLMDSVKNTAEKLGACGFIELQNLPEPAANDLLRRTVAECFDKPIGLTRMDKGNVQKFD